MYDYNQENSVKFPVKSFPKSTGKQADPFDDMFEFEATIKNRLTPEQRKRIEREELLKKDPKSLRLSEQLYVMYASVEEANQDVLIEICRDMARKDGATAF